MIVTVHFGCIIDDMMEPIASKDWSLTDDNLNVVAEEIAGDYLRFKQVVDKYGNHTYLEIPMELTNLQRMIDSYLDPILMCNHERTMDGGCPKCGDPSF